MFDRMGKPKKLFVLSSLLCSILSGASFTRFQTLRLQKIFPESLANQLISYGSCQFPTLGFVVERFKAIQSFIPETFYKIKGTNSTVHRHVDPAKLWVLRIFDSRSSSFSVLCAHLCLSAARGERGLRGVQLEKKPSLQPHRLPGALSDLHGGMCLVLHTCFCWPRNFFRSSNR